MIKTILIAALMISEEEAIIVFSSGSVLPATKRICAFFNRPLFVVSKMVVTTRKRAHVPIWSLDNDQIRMIKLISPKNVREKR